ncbi:TNT domain-containing protein [Bacteroidales bacterium OttesenSCG-928-A17]|nr:TNT domain-containing protein [Bacteroidales bacterium OttesenSCG-928-A17]
MILRKMIKGVGILDKYEVYEAGASFLTRRSEDATPNWGTPIPARSLPPNTNFNLHNAYQVAKPFPIQSSTIAPYYGMPGMGTQYVTPLPIQLLIDKGVLIRIIIQMP